MLIKKAGPLSASAAKVTSTFNIFRILLFMNTFGRIFMTKCSTLSFSRRSEDPFKSNSWQIHWFLVPKDFIFYEVYMRHLIFKIKFFQFWNAYTKRKLECLNLFTQFFFCLCMCLLMFLFIDTFVSAILIYISLHSQIQIIR